MKKKTHTEKSGKGSTRSIKEMAKQIETTYHNFGVEVEIVEATDGLRNYNFHLRPTKPVRMKVFKSFLDDLRYELSTDRIDIEAPIPDTRLVGITVPKREDPVPVNWSDAIQDPDFTATDNLTFPLGMDESGSMNYANIKRMPHFLMGGATGSGKTIVLHAMICSLIQKNDPDQLRLLLVDPKRVEFSVYNNLPHLLTPPVQDAKNTLRALRWLVREMERRYDVLQENRVMNIDSYREKIHNADDPMPYIVVIIDEVADIMHKYQDSSEASLITLAQMARAVGIHMCISTQRPSTNVITGMIKANIPSRIALRVPTQYDSRTILDQVGAEALAGEGDMLYVSPEEWEATRIQGVSIDESTVKKCVKASVEKYGRQEEIRAMQTADITANVLELEEMDDLYPEAKRVVTTEGGRASTSYLQRTLKIGYSRAAKLLDILEEHGVVGPSQGSKPREILVHE